MCGIAGFWSKPGTWPREDSASVLEKMAATLRHRGPDDSGIYIDAGNCLALAHRRLSILDLSSAGHQPMVSACGRYVIVLNGEIYNHLDLRAELRNRPDAQAWRGHSDTESLLAVIAAWGVDEALKKCVGMFAFVLWDKKKKALVLARDRLGEKPLYYGWVNDAFLFASELKAFREYPEFCGEINRGALMLYMRHNCVPAPHSIYQNIFKLPPGSLLYASLGHKDVQPICYWSAREIAERGQANPFVGTDAEAADELEYLLGRSIAGQMVADVPLGAFLSGGIDSASIVALMQANSGRPVQTYTIGFHEDSFNEAPQANMVASHLGTEHTELYVTPDEAMAVIPKLPELYDEPFSDSSQIPTFLVSQLARERVTVSLSGDGGDELFGGYNRHYWAALLWRRIKFLPRPVRIALAAAMQSLPPTSWDSIFAHLGRFLPASAKQRNPGDKLHKMAGVLAARGVEEIYLDLVSHWKKPAQIVRHSAEPMSLVTDPASRVNSGQFENNMMYLDMLTYLPDDILTKVDRASMGVSLESRIPMLDHRVVEFAWRLPLDMKIRNGQGKWLLRQVLYRHVPRELVERPKSGFGLPIGDWLRGPLRDWAEELLREERLKREGIFNAEPIRAAWYEHLSGRRNNAYHLWDVLMFQAWLVQVGGHG